MKLEDGFVSTFNHYQVSFRGVDGMKQLGGPNIYLWALILLDLSRISNQPIINHLYDGSTRAPLQMVGRRDRGPW